MTLLYKGARLSKSGTLAFILFILPDIAFNLLFNVREGLLNIIQLYL